MEEVIKQCMKKTKKFWKIKDKTLYHNTISLITAQKIAFSKSREIRKNLYALNDNNDEYDYNLFNTFTKDQFKNCGIENDNLIDCILNVTKLAIKNDLTVDNIAKLKCIGDWTIKSLKILNKLDDELFLFEDYWIRQRLSELLQSKTILSQQECKKLTKTWTDKSKISRFLWRINKNGTHKIINNANLERTDFV